MADLIHVQVVAPAALRDEVTRYIEELGAGCNVIVMADAARQPHGDVITFDLAREAVNEVLGHLEDLGVVEQGSITVFHSELTLSRAAELAQARAPGEPEDAVIWDEVAAMLRGSVILSWGYLAFFIVAAVIAAVGVLTDSSILIVGAMVVGPEYAPLAGVAFGIFHRDGRLVRRGLGTFSVGTVVAVGAAIVVGLFVRVIDRVPEPYRLDERELTTFIADPDVFTVIVAAAAAVAGMLALTQDRAGTLVGVLISVTTIPAIAEIGVGVALGQGDDVLGALAQLGLNLVCLVLAGVATLLVLRRISPGLPAATFP